MKLDLREEVQKIQNNDTPTHIHKLVSSRLKKIDYKLYQYCSFDSTNNPFSDDPIDSLSNLYFKNVLNRQIYASKPSGFNDPFDCVIGVSTQTILSAIVMSFLNSEYLKPRINKGEVKRMLNGEINHQRSIEILSHRAPNLVNDVILGILNNPSVQSRLQQANKKRISKAESNELFVQIFQDKKFIDSFVNNFIKPEFSSNETVEKISSLLISSSSLMSQLMIGSSSMELDENGKVTNFNLSLDKLQNIATIQGYDVEKDAVALKDTLEVAFSVASKGLTQFSQQIDEQFGITCFSERSDIALMWSHYAKKHTGFVVEYDFSNLTEEDAQKISFLMKVNYSKFRPALDNRLLDDINVHKKDFQFKDTILSGVVSALYTKSSIWRYEKEWRNIALVKHTDNRKIPLNYISKIILGANIPTTAMEHFKRLHELTGIPVARYKLDDDKYDLILESFDFYTIDETEKL